MNSEEEKEILEEEEVIMVDDETIANGSAALSPVVHAGKRSLVPELNSIPLNRFSGIHAGLR